MRSQAVSRHVSAYQSPLRSAAHSRNASPNRFTTASQIKPIYFCHYRNAMYMGGVRINDRHGYGIVLHDNGCSAVTTHQSNILNGHSIIIDGSGNMLSCDLNRGKCTEAVLRTDSHLLFVKYKGESAEGDSVLISYEQREIVYARFSNGSVTAKRIEKDEIMKERIFESRQFDILIPKRHVKALEFKSEFGNDIRSDRQGNKVTVGFSRSNQLEGLGFKLVERIIDKQLPGELKSTLSTQVLLSERGLYNGSMLDGVGQRRFQNSNVYIGEFVRDQFEGSGLLINNSKRNWVCGRFSAGNLVDLTSYNNEGSTQLPDLKVLSDIHRKKSSWRDVDVVLPDILQFRKEVRKIENFKEDSFQVANVEIRKQEMLKRIQYNFMHDNEPDTIDRYSQLLATPNASNSNRLLDTTHPQAPKSKSINNFETTFDKSTQRVRLRPLAITPDLRRRVEEQDKQHESKNFKAKLWNLFKKDEGRPSDEEDNALQRATITKPPSTKHNRNDSNSHSRRKIFGNTLESTARNPLESTERKREPTLSSSKRNRIFSTNRSPENNSSRLSPMNRIRDELQEEPLRAHNNPPFNESTQNKETARLREQYSPIASRRSKEDSLESSKRLVGDRLKIFKTSATDEQPVSFRYRAFEGNSRSPSSRRNRIF